MITTGLNSGDSLSASFLDMCRSNVKCLAADAWLSYYPNVHIAAHLTHVIVVLMSSLLDQTCMILTVTWPLLSVYIAVLHAAVCVEQKFHDGGRSTFA